MTWQREGSSGSTRWLHPRHLRCSQRRPILYMLCRASLKPRRVSLTHSEAEEERHRHLDHPTRWSWDLASRPDDINGFGGRRPIRVQRLIMTLETNSLDLILFLSSFPAVTEGSSVHLNRWPLPRDRGSGNTCLAEGSCCV